MGLYPPPYSKKLLGQRNAMSGCKDWRSGSNLVSLKSCNTSAPQAGSPALPAALASFSPLELGG